jgi:hypothetical protein
MSTSINNAFIRQYEKDVHHIFQRMGGKLRPTVRMKPNVVGSSTTFQKIGTGIATTKARHAAITPMNQDHTAIECSLSDFYAGDWVDRLDEAKTNIDERMAIAKGGAWALGRKVDDQIITVLNTTTESSVGWTEASSAGIRNSLLQMVEALDDNDVPDDGMRFGLLTPRAWSFAMTVEEFASSDYVGASDLPFANSGFSQKFRSWMGVNWLRHTGLTGKGTNAAKVFAYHADAIGYATGAHAGNVAENEGVSVDIMWYGDRAAHFVNHMMSGGCCLIDTTGVIEGDVDDTAAIPTS